MANFGSYETVNELYRHGHGTVFLARKTGSRGKPRFVVKTFQPSLRLDDEAALKAAAAAFLGRAKAQQEVSAAGGTHWAPIFELGQGTAVDSAYQVTSWYPWSAQRLIAARFKLSESTLHTIATDVLQGLIELKKFRGRAHGDLKPTNVLLTDGNVNRAGVVLADPLATEALPSTGAEGADIAALGDLLYQLVLHRPFQGWQTLPITPSPEWTRLGPTAPGWIALCNRLLDPEAADKLTLHALRQELNGLRARTPLITVPRAAAAVLFVAISAGGLGFLEYRHYAGQWTAFCAADQQWLHQFQADLKSNPDRFHRIEKDGQLHNPIDEIDDKGADLDPSAIAGKAGGDVSGLASHPPLSWKGVTKTAAALQSIAGLQQAVSPNNWELLKKVVAHEQLYRQRGWDKAADELAALIKHVEPQPDAPVVEGIDGLIAAQPHLEDVFGPIEEAWQSVVNVRDLIAAKAPDDPVLKQFDGFIRTYIASSTAKSSAGDKADELDNLGHALSDKELIRLESDLSELLQNEWTSKIDHERFAKEEKVHQANDAADFETFKAWLRSVKDYYHYESASLVTAAHDLDTIAANTRHMIDAVPKDIPNYAQVVSGLNDRLRAAVNLIAEFRKTAWVQKDVRLDAIASRMRDIENTFKTLQQDVQLVAARQKMDPAAWFAQLQTQTLGDSKAINDAWKQWTQKLAPGTSPIDPAAFDEMSSHAEQWKAALLNLDKQMPPIPVIDEPYRSKAKAKREEELASALKAVTWSNGQPDLTALASVGKNCAENYDAWCKDLPALIEDFTQAAALLDAGYSSGEEGGAPLVQLRTRWNEKPIFVELRNQGVLADVMKRLDALDALAKAPRERLAALAAAPDSQPEISLGAWRLLGKMQSPAWPANAGELAQETAARHNLSKWIDQLKDPLRRKQLSVEIRERGRQALGNFLLSPRPAEEVEQAILAAADDAGQFGIPLPGDYAYRRFSALADGLPLDSPHRFDVLLVGFRQSAAASDLTDPKASQLCDAFLEEVKKLPDDFKANPDVARFLSRLNALNQPDAGPTPPLGWQLALQPDGTYKMLAANPQSPPLQFARVDLIAGKPTYICTTEFRFADFLAVAGSCQPGSGPDSVIPSFGPKADPRPGPHIWTWTPASGFVQPEYWLRLHDDDSDDYPVPFKSSAYNRSSLDAKFGGNPYNRPKLPMNYLPAPAAIYIASLWGCRLPTHDEWAAAATISNKSGHLRGAAFKAERDFVAGHGGSPEYPDAGIFWPASYHGPRKTGANADVSQNFDGPLWFREAAETDGEVFHDLYGNVGEYVWDAPADYERLPYKSISGIKSMLLANPTKLSVIGGSALSPPELALDVPLPVDLQNKDVPNPWTGYSDVGMRLAFSASVSKQTDKLAWILQRQSYVSGGLSPSTNASTPQ